MKKVITTLIAVGALSITAQAQDWSGFVGNYTDAEVSSHLDKLGVITNNPSPNTFLGPVIFPLNFIQSVESDTVTMRLRYPSGGGAEVAYESELYYMHDTSPGVPQAYTLVGSGLTPGDTYTVAAYGVWGGTKDNLAFSLDKGATWSLSYGVNEISNPLAGSDWLVGSTTDAIGTPTGVAAYPGGSTRARVLIGDMQVDAAGELWVGVKDPGYRSTGPLWSDQASNDRGRFDGFAIAPGSIDVVPEPTTFALAGLGAAALLIFRRRS